MIGIGPYSIRVVIVFAAALIAWATARILARRLPGAAARAAGGVVFDALLLGLLAARLGYIVQWRDEYSRSPLSMFAIGDGGFSWWIGIPAGLLFAWWRTRSARTLRLPALSGIAAGVVAWFVAGAAIDLLQRSAPPLPSLELATLDARPVALDSYRGQPVVLNLWATWCAPCRREMPVLEQAQKDYPRIAFVMANQGEGAQQARAFLEREGLAFEHVLLDPSSRLVREVGTRGLPTTLFFDAQGRLVDSHLGELTSARLRSMVSRRFGLSPQPGGGGGSSRQAR